MFNSVLFRKATSLVTAFSLFTALLLTGCSSTTVINSNPSGATVTINGKSYGETPVTYKDKAIVGTSQTIILKKDGYKTTTAKFSRDGDVNVGAVIGGIFLLFPFLWTMDYEDNYTFDLEAE